MSDGTLKRVRLSFERNFTQLPNEWLRDQNLSLRARGLLGLLMSHDEGYSVTVKSLVATNPEGREAIEGAVRELKAGLYLTHTKVRGRGNRIEGVVWELTDPVEQRRLIAAQQMFTFGKPPVRPEPGIPGHGETGARENRDTENPHLKEQQPTEHLLRDLPTNHSTHAGTNEDGSAGSTTAATAIDEPTAVARIIHQTCPLHAPQEHNFASGTCPWCGIRATHRWRGDDIVPTDELLAALGATA